MLSSARLDAAVCCWLIWLHRAPAQERGETLPQQPCSYHDVISSDEEGALRSVQAITSGVSNVAEPVQAAIEHFEKRYKRLWDQDKDAYMRRYEKAQKSLSSYEADVTEYQHKSVSCAVQMPRSYFSLLRPVP